MRGLSFRNAVWICLLAVACDGQESTPVEPASNEADHQVRRLREDTEIELQDLRGRWLAAEGLLARQRRSTLALEQRLDHTDDHLERRLAELEVELGSLRAQIDVLERLAWRSAPRDTQLERLARSYEEIFCLRKRGAEESVAAVYRRYGFEDADGWAEAWARAARNEAFEREVSARVERLCP